MGLYRNCLPAIGGYLTDAGELNLKNVSVILGVVGEREDTIFKRRKEREAMMKRRREQNKRTKQADARRNLKEGHNRLAAEAARKMSAPTALGKSKHAKDAVAKSLDVDAALKELDAKDTEAAAKGGDTVGISVSKEDVDTTKRKRKRGDDDDEEDDDKDGLSQSSTAGTKKMKSGTEVKEDAKGGDEGGSSDSDSDGVEDLMGLLDDVPSSSSSAAATTEKKGKKLKLTWRQILTEKRLKLTWRQILTLSKPTRTS